VPNEALEDEDAADTAENGDDDADVEADDPGDDA
jgi:hypothetical protein